MIADGYTWAAEVQGIRFLYRPVLKHQREQLIHCFGTDTSLWGLWIYQHLLGCGNPSNIASRARNEIVSTEDMSVIDVALGVASPQVADTPWTPDWERRGAENLIAGLKLLKDHPGYASRSCEDCQTWWYRDDGSRVTTASGDPVPRPKGELLLCQTRSGCPKGTPERQNGLLPHNKSCFSHFRLCESINQFPSDPLVASNAIVIRNAIRGAA